MAKNYFVYQNNQDLERIYRAIIVWFKAKQYEVEGIEKQDIYLIQARKTGAIRTLLGTNLAFKIQIYISQDKFTNQREFIIETSRGKWFQNIAGAGFAGIFTGGFTVLTGVANAGWGLVLENELLSYVENDLNYSRIKADIDNINPPNIEIKKPDFSYQNNVFKNPNQKQIIEELEKEINKLEIAFGDEILTESEFLRKKNLLEKQIDDYEVNFLLEDKIKKLQDAFSQGILDQDEYEEKLQELESNTRDKILQERRLQRNKDKISKLKEALDNGIITKQEYQAKISNL
ncbi:SHOCT domain-containing protein [Geminocystis herdmanii]|uniref:SHOCT domain-containing protein n=1 Tax=Geminocystis herdmanii TaxID=669359 RepID=UPI00034503DC|nr:SHOCT domain-containing protein [Geminocystis herdmanii]